jgi:hypothetical protein
MQIPVTIGDQRLNQALSVLSAFGGATDPNSIISLLGTVLGNSQQADSKNAAENAAYWQQVGGVL